MSDFNYKQRPVTKEYEEGFIRIFGTRKYSSNSLKFLKNKTESYEGFDDIKSKDEIENDR